MDQTPKPQSNNTQTAEGRLREQVEISSQIQARLDEQIELTSTAERKLEQNVELAAAIANSLGEGVYAFDLSGRITYVNPAAERMLGWTIAELLKSEYPTLTRAPLAHLLTHGSIVHHEEESFTRRDGTTFCAHYTCAPIRIQQEITGGVVVFRDITDLKQAQEALRRADKLASAGRMAAAMAHEINNPLQAVTNLHLLMKGHELQPSTREFLSMAERELRRIGHITQQHLHFYRESSSPVPVEVCRVLDEVVAIREVQHVWPKAEMVKDYRASATILGFPGEMRQLLANLLSNCVEAGGTRITIRVNSFTGWRDRRKWVRISIADNASGIPPTCRQNIFEPFFTTKGEKGNGLGLWVCRGIVVRHDGSIRFRTSTRLADHGTVMSVMFPALDVRPLARGSSACA